MNELRVVPNEKVPANLKQATFEFNPPLEAWATLPNQRDIFPGDFIKRDDDGRIFRTSFEECTHSFVGLHAGLAYVQPIKKK